MTRPIDSARKAIDSARSTLNEARAELNRRAARIAELEAEVERLREQLEGVDGLLPPRPEKWVKTPHDWRLEKIADLVAGETMLRTFVNDETGHARATLYDYMAWWSEEHQNATWLSNLENVIFERDEFARWLRDRAGGYWRWSDDSDGMEFVALRRGR